MPRQKLAQGLGQRGLFARLRQGGAQLIETQQLAQHAPETRTQQVAALGKHGCQVGTAPLQRPGAECAGARHLEQFFATN